MSTYSEKLLRGETPSDEDWAQHLVEAHSGDPSMTPDGFQPFVTREGRTSYAVLAEALPAGAGCAIDLACGDGVLSANVLPLLPPAGRLIGVDMTEAGLEVARRAFPDPRASFVCARADRMPVEDACADAILCHLAFMLMLPVEPVVREIARVLKAGGVFAAIIPAPRLSRVGYFGEVRGVIGGFIEKRFPAFRQARSGDPRVHDLEGLNSLFADGFGGASLTPCPLVIRADGEGVWTFMKDTYFVGMLPAPDKADLKRELVAFVGAEPVEFEFPLQLFRIQRL